MQPRRPETWEFAHDTAIDHLPSQTDSSQLDTACLRLFLLRQLNKSLGKTRKPAGHENANMIAESLA